MKTLAFGILVMGGCAALAKDTPEDLKKIADSVQRAAFAEDPEHPLERVEVSAIEGETGIYVAIRDTQPRWWGDFICFKYDRGRIEWVAGSSAVAEQSILEVRGFKLPGFSWPFVEVFGTTHMGNGSCYLYELRDNALRLVLQTRAVDSHASDLNVIRGGRLTANYRELDGDGRPDVEFLGVVDEYSDDGHETLLRSTPCRKVFLWDRRSNRFVEDRAQRKGFESYSVLEH